MLLQHLFPANESILTSKVLVEKRHRYRAGIYISRLCLKPLKDYSSNKGLTKRDGTCLTA